MIWPLGFPRTIRSWWYWRGGEHPGRIQDPEGMSVDNAGNLVGNAGGTLFPASTPRIVAAGAGN